MPRPASPESLQFLSPDQAKQIAASYGTPVFVYSEAVLLDRARRALAFTAPFGLTVRYAMKANPLAGLLRLFDSVGIQIDASSGPEAHRAMLAGVKPANIMITSQETPADLTALVSQGALFNATSLHQLEYYGSRFPGSDLSLRINPGLGSGHSRKTNTGGPTSSFGIWHEDIPNIKLIADKYHLKISKIHTHIGAGTDPQVWHEAARITLGLTEHFPEVNTINLGGGFKVARTSHESATDLALISKVIAELIEDFSRQTGRRLPLEIEPGTYLVANAGALISQVNDITSTGSAGFNFLKLNTGLTDIMRPSLYAAQHAIIVVNDQPPRPLPYVVVGHTCESGDLLTPEPMEPDVPTARLLQQADIGDLVVIEGVGAYCSSMSAKGYNSFPEPPEVLLKSDGGFTLLKKAATLPDLLSREL